MCCIWLMYLLHLLWMKHAVLWRFSLSLVFSVCSSGLLSVLQVPVLVVNSVHSWMSSWILSSLVSFRVVRIIVSWFPSMRVGCVCTIWHWHSGVVSFLFWVAKLIGASQCIAPCFLFLLFRCASVARCCRRRGVFVWCW